MRVLFVGDSPTVSTGFARCTRIVCNDLHSAGHEIHVLGISEFGDPHSYPYPIYPCRQPLDGANNQFGVDRLPILIDRLKPDLVIILQDPWNITEYLDYLDYYRELGTTTKPDYVPHYCPIIGWLAVDSKNQKLGRLNDLRHIVTWTEFAGMELRKAGYTGTWSIVPLGVDSSIFHPINQEEARSNLSSAILPSDFLVGVVGRNQARKRIDLSIQYFSEWVYRYEIPNAKLFLHVAPTNEKACDIISLVNYYNLAGKVILSEPHLGYGNSEVNMANVYNSFDVYMSTSQAEGWGLPCLEAMACGVACIVPDWAAFASSGGWTGEAVHRVACTSRALTAPMNAQAYTIGGIPDKELFIDGLHELYTNHQYRFDLGAKGLALSKKLTWDNTAKSFRETIENSVSCHAI